MVLARLPDAGFLVILCRFWNPHVETTEGGLTSEQFRIVKGQTMDHGYMNGPNYSKADFRFWYPGQVERLSGVVVLVPGSNGDGRGMVDDPIWRAFAVRHGMALVGCYFVDAGGDPILPICLHVRHGRSPRC